MDRHIDICGIRSHCTDSGKADGKAIVLMHGWGCNASTLASIQKLAEPTHRVINIDFPGFGSSAEPTEAWGVEQYARWLEEFIKALDIDKPILLGHSFGGRVGIVYASRNAVEKLILVDSAGIKPRRSLKYYFKVYSFKLMKLAAPVFLGKAKAAALIEKQRSKRGSSDYASSTPMMRAIMSRVVNEDLKGMMPKIKAPTLLIWGEKDTATPISDARTMERLIPGSGLVSFPGCGHYSFLDNPLQFAAVLKSFLNS